MLGHAARDDERVSEAVLATGRWVAGASRLHAASGRRRQAAIMAVLVLVLVVTIVGAVCLGPVTVSPSTVFQIVSHHTAGAPSERDWRLSQDVVIWHVRFPRVLLGVVVGAVLGVAGMAMQAMVRNPLAEPHLLGVTAGASTGAAAAILFGAGASFGSNATMVVAFLGALCAMLLILVLARSDRGTSPARLLLAGVAVGYLLSALTSLLILLSNSNEGARAVMFWLLGSLAQADWGVLPGVTLTATVGIGILYVCRRRLDVISVSDELARSVGIHPDRTRFGLVIVVALCIGAAVAVSGGIGFVGLVVPHLARRLVGMPHRHALPAAALLGSVLLVWADVAARVVLEPRELPIGVVTGLLGAPVLIVLVRRLSTGPI
jgi:iron complex transport system permease protein